LLLPEYHAAYKQLDVWYTCLRDYCKELGIDVEKLEEETTTAKEERKNAKEKTRKKVEQAKKTCYSFSECSRFHCSNSMIGAED
jgi:hypothetical protein